MTDPISAVGPVPDPAIAPGVDPDQPVTLASGEPCWVTFVRDVETHVAGVGRWLEGEVRHVERWLADRLLAHPHFEAADPPAGEAPTEAPTEAGPADVAAEKPARVPRAKATSEPAVTESAVGDTPTAG